MTEGRPAHSAPAELVLPPDVRGIDIGSLVLMFSNGMVIASPKNSRSHYTIQVEPEERRLNVHQTMDQEDREGLFKISFDQLERLVADDRFSGGMRRLVRPLRLSWLRQRPVTAVLGLWDVSQGAIDSAKRHKKRLVLDLDQLAMEAEVLEDIDDLEELPVGAKFSLFLQRLPRQARHIGNGFVLPRPDGRRQLKWIPTCVAQMLIADLRDVIAEYGNFSP